ncbi:MAG: hypothetical protein HY738_03655 [Bacteroidia bacterium]|nr:hypothetical protein [Bacteroidia bacterium]
MSKNGRIRFAIPATGVGLIKYAGYIAIKRINGETGQYPFHQEYRVAPPMAVVSPAKLNVLYRGIDNPVSIAAAGVSAEDIVASISNGTLASQGGGNFIARPGAGDKSSISVSTKMGGTSRTMEPPWEFRVKDVPDPIAKLAGLRGGTITKNKLLKTKGIIAELKNFVFDLSFQIIGFTLMTESSPGTYTEKNTESGDFSKEQKKLISETKVGQYIFIKDIRVKGPDGKMRIINDMIFKIVE